MQIFEKESTRVTPEGNACPENRFDVSPVADSLQT